ncbi:MAG: methyltransferase domain-containing protein [Anaerolineaceae bacterium]|nr:methyltransferase domain-containing protein [Anaerolineaceae bacterium]
MKQWYEELYEDFAAYDKEPYTQNTMSEVDFIEGEIGRDHSKRILDVGCGNGRHTLELARRGYAAVGVDLSESMLARGRQIANEEKLNVDLNQCDARKINYQEEFDVAIMLCEGAFSLMEEDRMDRLILANIFYALRAHGKLIMTAPNAAFMLTKQSDATFDPLTFRETFKLEKKRSDGSNKMLDCTQRYYTCPELNGLLRQVGFKTVEFFACTKAGYNRVAKPDTKHFELGAIAIK